MLMHPRKPPDEIRGYAVSTVSTSLPASPIKDSSLSPTKFIQKIFTSGHMSPTKRAKRKRGPDRPNGGNMSAKKVKAELQPILPSGDTNFDLDAMPKPDDCTLDPLKTVKYFTLNLAKLRFA
jgi:hypothetical protein